MFLNQRSSKVGSHFCLEFTDEDLIAEPGLHTISFHEIPQKKGKACDKCRETL